MSPTKPKTEATENSDGLPCRLGCPAYVVFPMPVARRLHYMCMHRVTDPGTLDKLDTIGNLNISLRMTDAEEESFCWLRWCTHCGLIASSFADSEAHTKQGSCMNSEQRSAGAVSMINYWCQLCPPDSSTSSFTRRDYRERHYRRVHDDLAMMERICTVCGRVSRTKFGNWDHMKAHLPTNRPLECDLGCVRVFFKDKLHMYEHYKSAHPAVARSSYGGVKCPVCLRTFASVPSMQAHGEQHRYDGRPFKCVMGCRQANFVTQLGLDMHYSRAHHKQKVSVLRTRVVHRCSVCNEQQSGIETLTEHMRCHNPSLAFACPQCTRTYFHTAEDLALHMEMRHDVVKCEEVEVP